jgi:hypothetical protein
VTEEQQAGPRRQVLDAPEPRLHGARLDVAELLAAQQRVHVHAETVLDRQPRRPGTAIVLLGIALARRLPTEASTERSNL